MTPNGFKMTYRAAAVAGVLALLALTGCGNDKKADAAKAAAGQQMPAPQVGVQVVRLTTLPIVSEAAGRLVAVEVSEVRPQISGIVEEILFQEGSPVKAGQPLYRINADNYSSNAAANEAALYQAEASIGTAKAGILAQQAILAQAQADLERYKSLLEIGAVSRQLYDQALTNVKTAQAGLEQSRANLAASEAAAGAAQARIGASRLDMERTIVRAPISGKSGISSVTKGALVSAGQATPLVKISRFDPIFVDISQASNEILKLREAFRAGTASRGNLEVELVLADGSVYPIKGQLILDNGQVNETTGAITLRAVFDNPDGGLLPGMFVNARINQSVVENATLVPSDALIRTPKGETQVYVVEDKKIAVRTVTVAGSHNGQWVVTGGLNNGEQLVVLGANKVKPEQAVEVQVLPPAGAKGESESDEAGLSEVVPAKAGANSVLKPAADTPAKPEIAKPEITKRVADSSEQATKADDKADTNHNDKSDTKKTDEPSDTTKKAEQPTSKKEVAKEAPKQDGKKDVGGDSPVDSDLEKELLEAADDKPANP